MIRTRLPFQYTLFLDAYARTNLARLIFSDLHFEKTNISLIQTQLVADGLNIERASEII